MVAHHVSNGSSNTSPKKQLANQLNARKSTGPRTDAGKGRAAQNARRHGIFCKDLLVPGEEAADLEMFTREMLRSLNPRNVMELQVVEQIVADEWRIKRVRAAERAAYERLHQQDCRQIVDEAAKQRERWEREVANFKRIWAEEMREGRLSADARQRYERLCRLLAQSKLPPTLSSHNAGVATQRLLTDSAELERLAKYEQRLRNSVHRCLKELRQLRSAEPSELSPLTAELLEDQPPQEAIEKNEPTDSASDEATTTSQKEDALPNPRHADVPADPTGSNQSTKPATDENPSEPGGQ